MLGEVLLVEATRGMSTNSMTRTGQFFGKGGVLFQVAHFSRTFFASLIFVAIYLEPPVIMFTRQANNT